MQTPGGPIRRRISVGLALLSLGILGAWFTTDNASACSLVEPLTLSQVEAVVRHGDSTVLEKTWPYIPASIVGFFERTMVRHWPGDGTVDDAGGSVPTEYWGTPPKFEVAIHRGSNIYSPPTTSSCGPTPPLPPIGTTSYQAVLSTGGTVHVAVDRLTEVDRSLLADLFGGPRSVQAVEVPTEHPYLTPTTSSPATTSTREHDDDAVNALPDGEREAGGRGRVILFVGLAVAVIALMASSIAALRRRAAATKG